MYVSSKVRGISESVTLKLNAKANQLAEGGKKIFNLTAGQLPLRPDIDFVEKIKNEMESVKSFQYSPVSGFVDLRKKLMTHMENKRGISFNGLKEKFDCVVSNGGKHCLINILGVLLEPGDEVLLLGPYWISYPEMVKFYGGVPVSVMSNLSSSYLPSMAELKRKISKKTRAIIINSPNNPTGLHYGKAWMDEFANLMREYPEITIINDEIYDELVYTGEPVSYYYQGRNDLLERTIIVDSISKTLASPGLRIGYCIGPANVMSAISKLQGQATSGANSLIQRALVHYDLSRIANFLAPIKKRLKDNSQVVKNKLEAHGLTKLWYQPTSAFYYMFDFTHAPVLSRFKKNAQDDTDYADAICEELLERYGVAIVPGGDFGVTNSARISMVSETEEFTEAVEKLCQFLAER